MTGQFQVREELSGVNGKQLLHTLELNHERTGHEKVQPKVRIEFNPAVQDRDPHIPLNL